MKPPRHRPSDPNRPSALTPPSILDCTQQTFVANGTTAYFWADDLHLSASAQIVFGSAAISRAQNNPF